MYYMHIYAWLYVHTVQIAMQLLYVLYAYICMVVCTYSTNCNATVICIICIYMHGCMYIQYILQCNCYMYYMHIYAWLYVHTVQIAMQLLYVLYALICMVVCTYKLAVFVSPVLSCHLFTLSHIHQPLLLTAPFPVIVMSFSSQCEYKLLLTTQLESGD